MFKDGKRTIFYFISTFLVIIFIQQNVIAIEECVLSTIRDLRTNCGWFVSQSSWISVLVLVVGTIVFVIGAIVACYSTKWKSDIEPNLKLETSNGDFESRSGRGSETGSGNRRRNENRTRLFQTIPSTASSERSPLLEQIGLMNCVLDSSKDELQLYQTECRK